MRIIGIDPGLRRLGWGVIRSETGRLSHVASGVIESKGADLAARLHSLHAALSLIVEEFQPETAAVEQTFVNRNGAATLKLGQASVIDLLLVV